MRAEVVDLRASVLPPVELGHDVIHRDVRGVITDRRVPGTHLRDALGTSHPDGTRVHQHGPVDKHQQPHGARSPGTEPGQNPDDVALDAFVLRMHGFPPGRVLARQPGESYGDVAGRETPTS